MPLDGARSSERALPVAVNLSRGSGAALHLVRIHVRPERPPLSLEGMPVVDEEEDARCWAAERAYMAGVGERSGRRAELSTTIAVLDGPVEEVLATYASCEGIDLIVMATHGRHGLARAWLGSVGDALLRVSGVPVLLVRSFEETAWDAPEPGRPRILIALDGSRLSERVVEPAVALGRSLQATYTLLRVVNPLGMWGDPPGGLRPRQGRGGGGAAGSGSEGLPLRDRLVDAGAGSRGRYGRGALRASRGGHPGGVRTRGRLHHRDGHARPPWRLAARDGQRGGGGTARRARAAAAHRPGAAERNLGLRVLATGAVG